MRAARADPAVADGGAAGVARVAASGGTNEAYTHYDLQQRDPGGIWSRVSMPPLNSPYVTTTDLTASYVNTLLNTDPANVTRQFRVRTARAYSSGWYYGRWSAIVEG